MPVIIEWTYRMAPRKLKIPAEIWRWKWTGGHKTFAKRKKWWISFWTRKENSRCKPAGQRVPPKTSHHNLISLKIRWQLMLVLNSKKKNLVARTRAILFMTTCKNCANSFEGNYCPNCSQKADTHRFSVNHFAHEVFHAFTHADKRNFFLARSNSSGPEKSPVNSMKEKRRSISTRLRICCW